MYLPRGTTSASLEIQPEYVTFFRVKKERALLRQAKMISASGTKISRAALRATEDRPAILVFKNLNLEK